MATHSRYHHCANSQQTRRAILPRTALQLITLALFGCSRETETATTRAYYTELSVADPDELPDNWLFAASTPSGNRVLQPTKSNVSDSTSTVVSLPTRLFFFKSPKGRSETVETSLTETYITEVAEGERSAIAVNWRAIPTNGPKARSIWLPPGHGPPSDYYVATSQKILLTPGRHLLKVYGQKIDPVEETVRGELLFTAVVDSSASVPAPDK